MKIASIDECDLGPNSRQTPCGIETAKATADDDDMRDFHARISQPWISSGWYTDVNGLGEPGVRTTNSEQFRRPHSQLVYY